MTASPADRQRLKRQRRAEAGMVKVELWIHRDCRDRLRKGAERSGVQPNRAVEMLINDTWPKTKCDHVMIRIKRSSHRDAPYSVCPRCGVTSPA